MNSNYFKIVMQASAIALAIGGSFATKASEKIDCPGYASIQGVCSIQVLCTCTVGSLCIIIFNGITYPAYGKVIPSDTTCNIVRYNRLG